jgi:hypothetical protein
VRGVPGDWHPYRDNAFARHKGLGEMAAAQGVGHKREHPANLIGRMFRQLSRIELDQWHRMNFAVTVSLKAVLCRAASFSDLDN